MRLNDTLFPMCFAVPTRIEPGGSLPGEVRGLVFDTGDVLYDATAWRRWLLKVLARLGLHTNYRSFFSIWDHDFLVDVYCGRREFWEAFRSFLLSAGLTRGQIEEVQVAGQAQLAEWQAGLRPFPGVRSTLGRLAKCGVPMAAICDSEHSRATVEELLCRVGLAGALGEVVCSRDLAHSKPEPACYEAALEGLKLAAGEAAFVGHDAAELTAAARLGMPTIAFNHDPEARADVYLARFDELVELIPSARQVTAIG
jgi:HAD superfamily hydrolase (TIGR01509 family)